MIFDLHLARGSLLACASSGYLTVLSPSLRDVRARLPVAMDAECLRAAVLPRDDDDAGLVATGDAQGAVKLWDFPGAQDDLSSPIEPRAEMRMTRPGEESEVYALLWLDDDDDDRRRRRLGVAYDDCFSLVDPEMMYATNTYRFPSQRDPSTSYGGERNPAGKTFVFDACGDAARVWVALSDGAIQALDRRECRLLGDHRIVHSPTRSAIMAVEIGGNNLLASSSADGTCKIWDLRMMGSGHDESKRLIRSYESESRRPVLGCKLVKPTLDGGAAACYWFDDTVVVARLGGDDEISSVRKYPGHRVFCVEWMGSDDEFVVGGECRVGRSSRDCLHPDHHHHDDEHRKKRRVEEIAEHECLADCLILDAIDRGSRRRRTSDFPYHIPVEV